jgi:hypothetical protein
MERDSPSIGMALARRAGTIRPGTPTMRLFRQAAIGNGTGVIADMSGELQRPASTAPRDPANREEGSGACLLTRLRAGRFARERPESWPFVTQELTSLIGTCQICNMRPQMRPRLPQSRLSSLRGRSAPVCCDSRIAGHPRFGTGLQTTLGWEADQGIRGDWDRLRKAHQPDRNLSGFGSDGKTNLPLKQALEVRT